jgi:hypothetical protein
MAISNFHETMLCYAKQKSLFTKQITDIQFTIIAGTRKSLALQTQYNQKLQNYYYQYKDRDDLQAEYQALCDELETEYEYNLQNINSWEQELESRKENLDLRVAEITQQETAIKSLMKNNFKQDFTYGGAQQG